MNTPTPSKNETAVRLYDEAQVFEGSRPSGLLIQGGDEILRLERELAAVTEQRDRLAEAIITHRAKAWPLTGEQFDQDLWDTLAAVKGGADE